METVNSRLRYGHFCDNYSRLAKAQLDTVISSVKLQQLLSVRDCFDARKLILTGSGIGFAVAQSLFGLFTHKSDIMFGVELMEQSKFNYYADPNKLGVEEPNTPLILFFAETWDNQDLAQSLRVSQQLYADTIVICASGKGSSGAKFLELSLKQDDLDFMGIAYLSMLCAGFALAFRLMQVRGLYSEYEVTRIRKMLEGYFDQCQLCMPAIRNAAEDFAGRCSGKRLFEYIADWDRAGSANYLGILGARILGLQYDLSDSETWCHIDFWEECRQDICTVLVTDTNQPSFSRVMETANTVRLLERPYLIISDEAGCHSFCAPVPNATRELPWMNIFGNFLPGIITFGYMEATL